METTLYLELLNAVWREMLASKIKLFFLSVLLAFSVLIVGFFWPEKYEAKATLYADVTNIIKPLLEGRAEQTKFDRSKQAADKIYTRKILTKIGESAGLIQPDATTAMQGKVIKELRGNVVVSGRGKNYFEISYVNEDQDLTFKIISAVVDEFLKDSVDSRRMESRNAYEFIDQQVSAYKKQLIFAENDLKEFNSKNLDGDERSVRGRIEKLRIDIEEKKLTIDETESREKSLKQQLKSEGKLRKSRDDIDAQEDRLKKLRAQLDIYRLSYQETYPDVVAIKEQISALELVVGAMSDVDYIRTTSSSAGGVNPLYEDLRKQLAGMQVELESQRRRLGSMKKMMQGEYLRAERVASLGAERSELVRDYEVTKNIYEEMLGRKETARLSMTLDVEGQGVSYKIQEPALYPLSPSGVRFYHFALAGPLVGLVTVIGLMALYVLVDPRVRSPILLAKSLPVGIDLLGVIPHINTPVISRLQRVDMLVIVVGSLVFYTAYVVLALWNIGGIL
jgi:polysaccharide chain length determinant protein (PEP-CTERM system associated)